MGAVVARMEQLQVRYAGYFEHPIFHVLGNPADLYQNLLRRFHSYGADLQSLSVNLAELAGARVQCTFPPIGMVNVHLDRLEVFLADVSDLSQASAVVESAWLSVTDTAPSLRVATHEVTLSAWAQLENLDYRSYITRFVTTPADEWQPAVQFSHAGKSSRGSLLLEESNRVAGGLFARSIAAVENVECSVAQLMPRFAEQLSAQLRVVELHPEFRT